MIIHTIEDASNWGRELRFYTQERRLVIWAGEFGKHDSNEFTTLSKSDAKDLIKELERLLKHIS